MVNLCSEVSLPRDGITRTMASTYRNAMQTSRCLIQFEFPRGEVINYTDPRRHINNLPTPPRRQVKGARASAPHELRHLEPSPSRRVAFIWRTRYQFHRNNPFCRVTARENKYERILNPLCQLRVIWCQSTNSIIRFHSPESEWKSVRDLWGAPRTHH